MTISALCICNDGTGREHSAKILDLCVILHWGQMSSLVLYTVNVLLVPNPMIPPSSIVLSPISCKWHRWLEKKNSYLKQTNKQKTSPPKKIKHTHKKTPTKQKTNKNKKKTQRNPTPTKTNNKTKQTNKNHTHPNPVISAFFLREDTSFVPVEINPVPKC